MSLEKKLRIRTQRRVYRVRNAQVSRGEKLRISVFRSTTHIYAQIIDDAAQKTLASASSLDVKNIKGDKKEVARQVGLALGKKAAALKDAEKGFFMDRGAFLFHGRVKALAEGIRESGVQF